MTRCQIITISRAQPNIRKKMRLDIDTTTTTTTNHHC